MLKDLNIRFLTEKKKKNTSQYIHQYTHLTPTRSVHFPKVIERNSGKCGN